MFVITAIVGNNFKNDRSLSSASATMKSPRPSRPTTRAAEIGEHPRYAAHPTPADPDEMDPARLTEHRLPAPTPDPRCPSPRPAAPAIAPRSTSALGDPRRLPAPESDSPAR